MMRVESTVRPTALGLADKLVRLRERLRDPEWRRYGYLLMGGKMLGVALLLGINLATLWRMRKRWGLS